jgi:hypothetical protein
MICKVELRVVGAVLWWWVVGGSGENRKEGGYSGIGRTIIKNKKACHPSTLARKATRTIRSKIFLSSF